MTLEILAAGPRQDNDRARVDAALACRATAPIPTIRCLIAAAGRPAQRFPGDPNGLE